MSTDHRPASWSRDEGGLPARDFWQAVGRGARRCCPACGARSMFPRFLKVAPACPACGEELHHHRADDAPPYFTIMVVGHIVVPAMLVVERAFRPDLWVHGVLWTTLAIVLSLLCLPAIKGALIGYQWSMYMHGFDPRSGGDERWDGVGFEASRGNP